MASDGVAALRPAEFCALERELIASMAMRKKRNVQMAPMQELKLRLLERVQAEDPESSAFSAALARAIVDVSPDGATGPAQAVASDLEMDWQLACTSPGFVTWLRKAASPKV
ncbi:MAG: hypothetical protein JOY61_01115 [Chloroflexi bacterium]|nr:hypothetical protein [Chloroflexota bacterium]